MTRFASIVWVLVAAATLFFLRFGYEFGAGDQDELFSLLLHQLDPSLFSRDWFVVDQGNQFTVRTPFLWLMEGMMWVLPLWAATLLIYLVGWLGVAWGLFRLAEAFGASSLAASASTLLVLVAMPTWTLGGNTMAPNLLAPEMLGWALALPALRLALERRLVWAGALLALAAYLHLIVGALVTAALGLAILLGALGGTVRERVRSALILGGTVLLGALPMIVAIARYRSTGTTPSADELTPFFLFAELRLPHHYLPTEYPLGRWARFGLLAVLGAAGLVILRRHDRSMRAAERLMLAILLICAIAAPLIVWGRILFVAQLQPFKLTVLANAILAIAICAGLASSLPERIRNWNGLSPRLSLGLATGIVGLLSAGLASGQLDSRVGPWARAEEPFTEVETWISENTPRDALIASPPNRATFRLGSRRSVVVTFKAAPFHDGAMREWYRRLLFLAPHADQEVTRGLAFGHQLDEAYGLNQHADWDRIAATVGVTHIVRNRTGGEAPTGRLVFEAGTWEVYELTPSATSGEGENTRPVPGASALENRTEG